MGNKLDSKVLRNSKILVVIMVLAVLVLVSIPINYTKAAVDYKEEAGTYPDYFMAGNRSYESLHFYEGVTTVEFDVPIILINNKVSYIDEDMTKYGFSITVVEDPAGWTIKSYTSDGEITGGTSFLYSGETCYVTITRSNTLVVNGSSSSYTTYVYTIDDTICSFGNVGVTIKGYFNSNMNYDSLVSYKTMAIDSNISLVHSTSDLWDEHVGVYQDGGIATYKFDYPVYYGEKFDDLEELYPLYVDSSCKQYGFTMKRGVNYYYDIYGYTKKGNQEFYIYGNVHSPGSKFTIAMELSSSSYDTNTMYTQYNKDGKYAYKNIVYYVVLDKQNVKYSVSSDEDNLFGPDVMTVMEKFMMQISKMVDGYVGFFDTIFTWLTTTDVRYFIYISLGMFLLSFSVRYVRSIIF